MSYYVGKERPPELIGIGDVHRLFPTVVRGACPYGYDTVRTRDERGFLRVTACRLKPNYEWVQVRVAMRPVWRFVGYTTIRGIRVPKIEMYTPTRLEWRLVARAV